MKKTPPNCEWSWRGCPRKSRHRVHYKVMTTSGNNLQNVMFICEEHMAVLRNDKSYAYIKILAQGCPNI